MNDTNIYDNFLDIEEIKGNNEKFNFSFNTNSNEEEFEKEFLKFISLYNYFYFDTQRKSIATVINSYTCALDDKNVEHLKKLYDKAKILKKDAYIQVIAEFLFSYKKSLETEKYKKEIEKNKLGKYKRYLYKNFMQNDFKPTGEIFKNTIEFYKNIIKYVIKKNQLIGFDKEIRILSKFEKNEREEKDYKEIFDYILNQDKNLSKLMEYDYSIEIHLKQYKNKVLLNTENGYLREQSVEIFKQIVEHIGSEDEFIKTFINKYVNLCNELMKKGMLKKENSVLAISNFEQTIKELNKIKKVNINNKYKKKVNECICGILCVKRKILNDTEYINSHLKEHEFKIDISNNDIENMRKDILNSFSRIYPYVKMDFNDMIIQSIEAYSKYPMRYSITNITIGNNELYYINENKEIYNAFKDYYDIKGREYTIGNASKLRNLLKKDYYEHMLEYVKEEFNLKIGFIASVLHNDIKHIKNSIDLARRGGNIKNDNLYVEMATQIIGIEVNIYKLMQINGIKPEKGIEKNLELLFQKYKENEFYRNAIMNIYYILYCEQGYHLRNEIMHGNLLGQQDCVGELILIYTCMVAINYMVSNAKNGIK